jgi:hypothetical protein
MAKKIFSKMAWMARATTTVVGLAIMLALVFGVATTAIGATGGTFILGKANGATTVSKLTASIAGPALTLVNNSTSAAATALNINVAAGQPPLKVNATAGKATNLNADKLDGLDSAAFAGFGETAYSQVKNLSDCGGTIELESIPFSVSRPSHIYASGVARYSQASSNFTSGTISVELRDADDNTQLASGGSMTTNTGDRLSPISLQGVLHSGENIYFDSPGPFVATPGENYVLRLMGSSGNGTCDGSTPVMTHIALSYVLIGE